MGMIPPDGAPFMDMVRGRYGWGGRLTAAVVIVAIVLLVMLAVFGGGG